MKKIPMKAKKVTPSKKSATSKKLAIVPQKAPLLVKEPFNLSMLIKTLVERTELKKNQVLSVLESMTDIMIAHLGKKGPQQFKWPGILLMKIKNKAATKARKGINPFTGEPTTFAAKPARRVVKINPLKALKKAI